MPRTKAKSATRAKAEVDRSLLLAIADEINTLSALLRCQPSLGEATQLVRMARDQESPSQRDRLAELAHALFGEDLEAREEEALARISGMSNSALGSASNAPVPNGDLLRPLLGVGDDPIDDPPGTLQQLRREIVRMGYPHIYYSTLVDPSIRQAMAASTPTPT